MSSDKKKASRQLALLVPNAIRVQVDGGEIFVASNREENSMMNMVVASQIRSVLQETIKRLKERDVTLTPKELKELSDAARNVAEMSDSIYAGSEPITDQTDKDKEKNVTGQSTDLSSIDFNVMVKKPEDANKDLQPDQPPDNGGTVE